MGLPACRRRQEHLHVRGEHASGLKLPNGAIRIRRADYHAWLGACADDNGEA